MARTKSNIVIRDYPSFRVTKVNVAKATEVAMGDLIDFDGTDLYIHDGDNSDYIGVALSASSNTDVQDVSVATAAKIYAPVYSSSSAAATFGVGFKYQAGSNTVDWELTSGTSEGIAWALDSIAKGASGHFLTDSVTLNFLFDALTEA